MLGDVLTVHSPPSSIYPPFAVTGHDVNAASLRGLTKSVALTNANEEYNIDAAILGEAMEAIGKRVHSKQNTAPILRLPPECLAAIFQKLDNLSLIRCFFVNTYLKEVVETGTLRGRLAKQLNNYLNNKAADPNDNEPNPERLTLPLLTFAVMANSTSMFAKENPMNSIPKTWADLLKKRFSFYTVKKYLRAFDLSNTGYLKRLPLSSLQRAQRLKLSGYDLKGVDLKKQIPTTVKTLILSGYNLKDVDLSKLPNSLRRLTLNNCNGVDLTQLPTTLKDLTLKNYNGVDLTQLPNNPLLGLTLNNCNDVDLSKLPNSLRFLTLKNYNGLDLTQLPNSLWFLTLKNYNGLDLTQLPTTIADLVLNNCNGVDLSKLPTTIADLVLNNCNGIDLSNLPDGIKSLKLLVWDREDIIDLSKLPATLERLSISGRSIDLSSYRKKAQRNAEIKVSGVVVALLIAAIGARLYCTGTNPLRKLSFYR